MAGVLVTENADLEALCIWRYLIGTSIKICWYLITHPFISDFLGRKRFIPCYDDDYFWFSQSNFMLLDQWRVFENWWPESKPLGQEWGLQRRYQDNFTNNFSVTLYKLFHFHHLSQTLKAIVDNNVWHQSWAKNSDNYTANSPLRLKLIFLAAQFSVWWEEDSIFLFRAVEEGLDQLHRVHHVRGDHRQ